MHGDTSRIGSRAPQPTTIIFEMLFMGVEAMDFGKINRNRERKAKAENGNPLSAFVY